MGMVVAVLAIAVFGAGIFMVRVGLFKLFLEIWNMPRRK